MSKTPHPTDIFIGECAADKDKLHDYFLNYLFPVIVHKNSDKIAVIAKERELFVRSGNLIIRVSYKYTFSDHRLRFCVRKKSQKRYRGVVVIKAEERNSFYSNTIRFLIQSIILNHKLSVNPVFRHFAFVHNYVKIVGNKKQP